MNPKNVNSIKLWSIIVGVLSLSSLLILTVYPLFSAVGLLSAIALILGLTTAYAGIQVTSLSLKTVSAIFWAKFAWLIVNFLFSLVYGPNVIRLLIILVQAVIVWYLTMILKKMPQSQSQSQPQSVDSSMAFPSASSPKHMQ